MANTKKGAIKKTTKRGRDADEYTNMNDMGSEHTEREVEGREAEGRERYYSCSSTIEEEEELDDKITKKKKRNITENLRINLLRARTMNEKNGSMIQVRRTYVKKDVKNNETINPITNIADEEKKKMRKWKRKVK